MAAEIDRMRISAIVGADTDAANIKRMRVSAVVGAADAAVNVRRIRVSAIVDPEAVVNDYLNFVFT